MLTDAEYAAQLQREFSNEGQAPPTSTAQPYTSGGINIQEELEAQKLYANNNMLNGQIEGLPQLEDSLDQPQDQINYNDEYNNGVGSARKAEIEDMMIRE